LLRLGKFLLLLCLIECCAIPGRADSNPSNRDNCLSTSSTKDGCQKKTTVPARQETIVVTGTFTPMPLEDIDRSVDVIDTKSNSVIYNNWVDYLQLVPSVDLQQRAPGDVQTDLTIRGSTFGQTLVLLNGLRMNDVQTGHHNMDLPLPTAAIDRIEILRGAGSTLYGSDAMAGSINLIATPAAYSDYRVGSAIGNFGVNEETASADFLLGRWSQSLSIERDFSSGFEPDRDYRSLTAFSLSSLESALGQSELMLGYGDKPFGADQFYGPFNSWERTKSWFAGLEQDLGRDTEFDFGYRRHTDEFILLRNDPSAYENNHIDESWQADLRRKKTLRQNVTLFYGGAGFHESIDSNNLGIHERSHGAGYVDFDVRAWRRFSFSLGAREEILNSSHGEFSPTLAAGVWLRAGFKLKASVGRAFRLPTYTDLYYSDPATLGNPNLQPETAWDYEGGLLWDRGGRVGLEFTVFQRRTLNDIDYVQRSCSDFLPAAQCASPNIWHAENLGEVNFTGAETSATIRLPRRQQVEVSYTGLYGAQAALNGLQSEYVFNYPVHDATVSWQGMLPGNFLARTRVGVVDRYDSSPYALWDAAIGREFHHVSAHLDLANLTNTQYEEIQGVIMPGRSVVFGLEFFLRRKTD
jgi:outer membrane cobalamin receptor